MEVIRSIQINFFPIRYNGQSQLTILIKRKLACKNALTPKKYVDDQQARRKWRMSKLKKAQYT